MDNGDQKRSGTHRTTYSAAFWAASSDRGNDRASSAQGCPVDHMHTRAKRSHHLRRECNKRSAIEDVVQASCARWVTMTLRIDTQEGARRKPNRGANALSHSRERGSAENRHGKLNQKNLIVRTSTPCGIISQENAGYWH